jgi:hypothetical protein
MSACDSCTARLTRHVVTGGVRSTGYKKRWFVLTEEGDLLYFNQMDSTAPLGSLSLIDVLYFASIYVIVLFLTCGSQATVARHKDRADKLLVHTEKRSWGFRYDNGVSIHAILFLYGE